MIHNECRLDQVLLNVFLEEEVDYIALCMIGLVMDISLIGKLLGRLCIGYLVKIDIGILLDYVADNYCRRYYRCK